MSTYFPSGKDLAGNRKWYVIDAAGRTVGHLASEVAAILSGKRSPKWTPFMDMGDHVIVVNARKAVFKGSKAEQKVYRHHTRYPGGLREMSVTEMFERHPDRVIDLAVRGMLPKNKLGKAMANIPTRPSDPAPMNYPPAQVKTDKLIQLKDRNSSGRDSILRNGKTENFDCPCLPAARWRRRPGQPQGFCPVFSQRSTANDYSSAAATD